MACPSCDKEPCICPGDHLKHSQVKNKMPKEKDLCNDNAKHLHHPQIKRDKAF